jgi:NAD(P)-dependent dehydrogenase (short-subunit alcohol dehydrogenase family)
VTIDYDGRVAVVTGAAKGIGAALARELVERGARVLLTDLDADGVAATVDDLRQVRPGRAEGLAGDAADEAMLRDLIGRAEAAFGPVDLFFANAGVPGPGEVDASEAAWDLALQVNVMAHVRAARLLVPGWLERGRGWFVATASAAGLLTQIGAAPYSVTKHAVVAFAEWLSITYGDRGLAVSCLCPMGVDTALLHAGTASEDPAHRQGARVVTSAGDVLEPADVARATLDGVAAGEFLILPHPEVREFFRRRATDHDRWLAGMRRLQADVR